MKIEPIMTLEQFTAAYEALQEDKKIIENKIEALKQRYIESLPFKVGDCVRIKDYGCYLTQKAWITKIRLVIGYKLHKFNLTVVEPKKDGTPSRQERELMWICPEDVELIKEEG